MDVAKEGHISYLELVPVYQAVIRYAGSWRNQHVLCMTDNTQVVSAINKGTSINTLTMALLRDIFWVCVMYNIYLCARHIPGVNNVLPDLLSRIGETGSLSNIIPYSICCSGCLENR